MNKVARASCPFLFAVFCVIAISTRASTDLSQRRSIHDYRTGKEMSHAVANGTVYEFRSRVPGTTYWRTPAPLEGLWLESNDHQRLIWMSSMGGMVMDDTDPGCPPGSGGGGNCPPSGSTCGGVPYNPAVDCCVTDPFHPDGEVVPNGQAIGDCQACINGEVVG